MRPRFTSAAFNAALLAAVLAAAELQGPVVLRRVSAGEGGEVVAQASGPGVAPPNAEGRFNWGTKQRLEVLFVNRADPRQSQRVVSDAGPNDDCNARIERMSPATLLVSCIGEKGATYENRQFRYDQQSRKLVGRDAFMPFGADVRSDGIVMGNATEFLRVALDGAGEPHVSGATVRPSERTEQAGPGFHVARQRNILGSEHAVIEGGGKLYTLPQTAPDNAAEMNEEVGPHQWIEGRLWFGKTFYNGEGATGTGGFGYFDPAARAFKIYATPEIRCWSVSAILVEADAVWLALDHRGEYGNYPGGLLRWDRKTEQVRHLPLDQVGMSIARIAGVLSIGAPDGLILLHGDAPMSYLVERRPTGGWQMTRRDLAR